MMAVALLFAALPSMSVASEMDYPELQVVPRASERLKMESEKDTGFRLISWPILIPALATVGLGVVNANSLDAFRDPYRLSVYLPSAVGLAWVGISVYLAAAWSPYRAGWANVKESGSGGGKRDQLARERLAEEELSNAARTSFVLGLAATVTMAGASMMSVVTSNSSASAAISIGAAVISLAPLLLPMRPSHVYNQHLEYKKKIYGPIASVSVLPEPVTSRLSPGVSVALAF